ncbi:MAG TPA: DUF742 domain-containing protein [Planosporangium sp.]|jgi:hypothetical protein|nr:DUF742 domain-containing protein [Planosporangium sp.]
MIPPWQAPPPPPRHAEPERPEPEYESDAEDLAVDQVLVRPFLLTGGRTRPLHDGLRVETLVSALPAALSAPLRFEMRRIVELCQAPLSLAEIAVHLGIPLGVARVLVADLATEDYVSYAEPAELPIEMIERIRDRVRAL